MNSLKSFLKLLLIAIITAALLALIMLKLTMNFQWLLFIGAFVFFGVGWYNFKTKCNKFLAALVLVLPYAILFKLLVLPQLPKLYYFIPFYYTFAVLGLYFYSQRRKVLLSVLALLVVMVVLALKVMPSQIENSLTQFKSEPLPKFLLTDVEGNTIATDTLKGKTVIFDFFGTWCAPCRKELPELQKVKDAFKDNPNVVFYVINADIGGDTPQKFKSFIANHQYDFNYAYDEGSVIYKRLNLESVGLPTLLVVDKEQNIRMHHIGYNEAEVHFADNLIKLIESLD